MTREEFLARMFMLPLTVTKTPTLICFDNEHITVYCYNEEPAVIVFVNRGLNQRGDPFNGMAFERALELVNKALTSVPEEKPT